MEAVFSERVADLSHNSEMFGLQTRTSCWIDP